MVGRLNGLRGGERKGKGEKRGKEVKERARSTGGGHNVYFVGRRRRWGYRQVGEYEGMDEMDDERLNGDERGARSTGGDGSTDFVEEKERERGKSEGTKYRRGRLKGLRGGESEGKG